MRCRIHKVRIIFLVSFSLEPMLKYDQGRMGRKIRVETRLCHGSRLKVVLKNISKLCDQNLYAQVYATPIKNE